MEQPPATSPEDLANADDDSKLRSLAGRRMEEARAGKANALKMAKRHELAEYAVGLIGAIAGVLAAATLVRDQFAEWVALIALVASLAAAIGTFLKSKRLKNHHWSRYGGLGRLADDYETLIAAPEPVTSGQMMGLSERWEEWHQGLSD